VPRTYSLRLKKDFDELFKKGKRRASRNFNIVFSPANELKVAFIISKKNAVLATHRNYSKRIMREIFRKEILLNIKTPLHIAFISKTDLKELRKTTEFQQVKAEILSLFNIQSSPKL